MERLHGIHIASGVPLRLRLVPLVNAWTEIRLTCLTDPCYGELRQQLCRLMNHLAETWSEPKAQLRFSGDAGALTDGGKEFQALAAPPAASTPQKPMLPAKPGEADPRDAWLQYHQDMNDAGRRYTLNDLAKDMHLSVGRVKHLRGLWLAEHPQYQKDSTK